ncbi:hypothetical protein E2C01_055435 [Portunus trituberculatus]|uniref:Uncharacterized protein n=1 Tax=Portunus trituberculatus TaxID=210409 RepID=A0A5B7GVA3_PORTR|nr:hypothetical protein [Portunus trituberculatus]
MDRTHSSEPMDSHASRCQEAASNGFHQSRRHYLWKKNLPHFLLGEEEGVSKVLGHTWLNPSCKWTHLCMAHKKRDPQGVCGHALPKIYLE